MTRITYGALLLLVLGCGGPAVGPRAGPDDPIAAPPGRWSWIAFPDSACADGQATGIGINPSATSDEVVIYFQGGGACWDWTTCVAYPTAEHLDGYGAAELAAEPTLAAPAFDRASSPFADASFVFVPYCTGDIHAGEALRLYQFGGATRAIHHAGGANLALFLRRLAATFPGPRRILVMGSSAGGYGAQVNYPRLAAAFPQAELHALADGAQLVQPSGTRLADWQAAWGWTPPSACAACATSLPALARWLADTYPAARFGLLASTRDQVLQGFFGYADAASFDLATRALLTDRYAPTPNARWFALASTQHTMLGDLATASGDVTLAGWLEAWRTGQGWVSAGP